MSVRRWIGLGEVSAVFGVKGWIKVIAYTAERANILNYNPWCLQRQNEYVEYEVIDGCCHGKRIVVKLNTVDSREDAALLIGSKIVIDRAQLAPLRSDEFYWADLVGLEVVTVSNEVLGAVEYLMETGANDVLVIKGERERLIPFIHGQTVKEVDLNANKIVVDWDADY